MLSRAGSESAALFGDVHERNHVARIFASLILGNDAPPGGT